MNELNIQITAQGETGMPAGPVGNPDQPWAEAAGRGVDQMFLDYYGLNEQPFGVTPDLRFLYLGAQHRQALDVLNYGTELNRGFLTLIAQPGMGKTSLLFQYLEGLRDKARTVFLFQTDGDATELMRYLLAELGLDGKGMDLPEMRGVLGQVLTAEMQAGRRFVLVIDEAQNLSLNVLESIRLLSNFETPWMKLMHIVLAGQPQLADRLAEPSMIQLRQRISFAIRIEPFTREQVDRYIDHRLWVAGYNGLPLFSVGARALLAERSGGVPRIINNLCFCAMSYAWAMKRKTVDRATISGVLADLEAGSPKKKGLRATKLPQEAARSLSQISRRVALWLQSPPARGEFSKIVAVCAVLFAACWFVLQPRVERWIVTSFHGGSASASSALAPPSAPRTGNPSAASGRDRVSPRPKSEGFSRDKDSTAPAPGAAESTSTARSRD
jgi:type II secretory pathway predicted ATPase ExeA